MSEEKEQQSSNEDEFNESEPAFIDLNSTDVEEVKIDESQDLEPMEEDDDNVDNSDNMEVETSLPEDNSFCCIDCHCDSVYAVSMDCVLSADGNDAIQVSSGGGDDKAYLTTIQKQQAEIPLNLSEAPNNHSDTVSCVAFNTFALEENGKKLLAVGCYDGTVQLWDVLEGTLLHKLEGPTDVEWIAWHPKGGTVILAGSTDGTVWMYHALTSKCLQVFVGHEGDVTCGLFTKDGKFALSAGVDGTARIWAPRTGLSRHVFRFESSGASAPITCMDVSSSSKEQPSLFICGSENGSAYVCHVGNKKVVYTLRHTDQDGAVMEDEEEAKTISVEAVGFFPGNTNNLYNWCATGGVDGLLKVWDLGNNGQCRQVCAHGGDSAGGITRLQWHPTLPLIFTATTDGIIRLWDARTGQCLETVTGGHVEIINDMDIFFDTNGNATLVTGSDDGKVRLFWVDVNLALTK